MAIPPGNYAGQTLTATQTANIERVFNVGRRMGANDRDLITAAITTRVESNHMNLTYGDRDSQGIFQQRPSQGWGTVAQVTNIEYASEQFFKRLLVIPNRATMTPGAAAQTVQRSAFPARYDIYVGHGEALVRTYVEGGGTSGSIGDGGLGIGIPGIDIPNPFEDLQKAAAIITDPHMWLRIGMFILGGTLLIVALMKMTGDNKLSDTTKTVVGAVVLRGKGGAK